MQGPAQLTTAWLTLFCSGFAIMLFDLWK